MTAKLHQFRTLANLRDPAKAGLPKLLSGELSLPAAMLAAQAGVADANPPESPDRSNQRRQKP